MRIKSHFIGNKIMYTWICQDWATHLTRVKYNRTLQRHID